MTSTTKIEEIDDNYNPLSQHLTSEVIRSRLLKKNVSFFANDNIADHIEPGEIEKLEAEVADRIRDLLKSLIIDIDNDQNTLEDERVARIYIKEVFKGINHKRPKVTSFPNVKKLD